jgi:long-chain acyl-CoA synthetase
MVTFDLAMLFDKVERLISDGHLEQAVIAPFASLLPTVKSILFRLFKSKQIARWRTSSVRPKLVDSADLAQSNGTLPTLDIDPYNDPAVLQYTGGTTGTPKGATLTHANLTINVAQIIDWATDLKPGEERIMGVLPFFHVFAMTTILNFGIAYGMEIIMLPKFELDPTLKLINSLKPTVMPGVPTLYNAMLNHPKIASFDLSSLTFCISGGAALPLEVRQGFETATGCTLIEGYGLSETAPVVTINPADGPARDGSIGLPVPATDISIRSIEDPSQEMPLGEAGEICIKGPQVMPGYWNKPEETAESFVDGYFRTGDVARFDEDGFIYIVDRLKDMINASGYKIYPRQVEDAIYRHPAVEEVTVIGIPDEYRGEAPKAFIKLKQGRTSNEEEIMTFLKTQISKLELPAEIEFRDELPKTMIGKLSRKELRQTDPESPTV